MLACISRGCSLEHKQEQFLFAYTAPEISYKLPENIALAVMWLGKTHTSTLCIPQEDNLQDSYKLVIAEATFPLSFINEKEMVLLTK